jgi:WD40 repeat protein/DNA-binding SARP family transcriptional activator
MEIRVLGPVEVRADGRSVAIGAGKPRALLVMLALYEGSTVSTDRLVEGLWGEEAPATAAKMVQLAVSQLRKALAGAGGGAEIITRGRGYELRLGSGGLDARRFEQLVEGGMPREGLALWRGRPLADLADQPFAVEEIRRLEKLRVTALELAIEQDLAAGRHREVVGELDALVAEEPLRERLHAHRMLALYRLGRQAEALEAYRHARRAVVEAIGVEPGPELRRLHEAILRQDPELEPPDDEVSELPAELYAGAPLAGREAELDSLREYWRRAHGGAGQFVLIVGPRGIGKTRLAAELAGEVHRDRGAVLYASGVGPRTSARATLERAAAARRPTLLVVDDVDRASDELRAALGELVDHLAAMWVLVVATAEDGRVAGPVSADKSLTLAPLDADGVAAIARPYASAGEDVAVPVARLLAASGGVPERIHRTAGEWAREEAARRLDAAAGRAASERAGLRAAEDEVVGTVVELEAARERARPPPDSADVVVVCPFKGLASFDAEDAAFFFGRERLVAEMVARLAGAPLMGIVGPSGSGKSSALSAGLLPALAEGVLPGSEGWSLVRLRPGEHPMRALEDATADAAPLSRLVLAVDQFEEVFTACRHESERKAFVDVLVAYVRDSRRAVVLVAVRADFYGRCAAYPELWRLLGASQVPVGPMRRDELRRAIELPARRAGLQVEPDLTEALIADVEGEPGALPLLSTSLLELWQHRDGRRLRLAAYEQAGGVHGAVARLAEAAYERLDAAQQRVARAILLRLAGEGGGDAAVGARVGLEEFGEDAGPVLAELTDSRLLTVSEGAVEVAHEALLREWPRLRGWLEDDAEGRRLHRNLRGTAKEWEAGGRDPGDLYRGARLASALDWATEHDPELNDVERAFLDDSEAASGRAHRRLRMVLAGAAALLLLAVIAGAVALDQRGSARREAVAADAQRLGAQALVEDDLDRSLLLARQGVALDDALQTRGNLLAALLKSPAAIGVVRGDGDRLISLDLSPDERTLAFLDHDGTLSFVDARTRRPAGPPITVPGLAGVIVDAFIRPEVQFSPDGSRLAVGGGKPIVLDAHTHRVLATLRTGDRKWCLEPGGACWILYAVRFAPDGRTLIAAVTGPPDWNKMILRFDASSGRQLGRARRVARAPDGLPVLMLTRDGRRLVTTFEGCGGLPGEACAPEGATAIRDARTLRPLKRIPGGGQAAALSPDDRTMLAGAGDGSVRFVDLVSGDVRSASGRHDGAVVQAAFSANGAFATTAGADGRAIVWDVHQAAAGETLEGHAGQITGLTISRDSSTLYTAALDGKVIVWDLAGARRLGRPFDVGPDNPRGDPRSALSPDGRVLAVGHGDGTVSLIDARTLRTLSTFRVLSNNGQVQGIGYVPHRGLLVVGGDDGFLALVDPGRGTILKRLPGHGDSVFTPSFTADGRLMATASNDGTVRLWALPSGRPVGRPLRYSSKSLANTRSNGVGDVSLSPDGRLLAVTRPPTGGVEILDVATRRRRASLSEAKTVWDLARFTPDGRYIVAGSYKGWVRLWSTETWRPVTRVFTGPAGRVEWEATSADGRTLATGGPDGTIRLWDLRTQQPLGAPLPGVPNRAVAPQFSPDGAYLFAVTNAGRGFRWDVRPSSWANHACEVAGRPLTRAEWKDALPGRDYDPAC